MIVKCSKNYHKETKRDPNWFVSCKQVDNRHRWITAFFKPGHQSYSESYALSLQQKTEWSFMSSETAPVSGPFLLWINSQQFVLESEKFLNSWESLWNAFLLVGDTNSLPVLLFNGFAFTSHNNILAAIDEETKNWSRFWCGSGHNYNTLHLKKAWLEIWIESRVMLHNVLFNRWNGSSSKSLCKA